MSQIILQIDTTNAFQGKIGLYGNHNGFIESDLYNIFAEGAIYPNGPFEEPDPVFNIEYGSPVTTEFNSTFDNSNLINDIINSINIEFENYVQLNIIDTTQWGLHDINMGSYDYILFNVTVHTLNALNSQISTFVEYYDILTNNWKNVYGNSNSLEIKFDKMICGGRIPDYISLKIFSIYTYDRDEPTKNNADVFETGTLNYQIEINSNNNGVDSSRWLDVNSLNAPIKFSISSIRNPFIDMIINLGNNPITKFDDHAYYSKEFDENISLPTKLFSEKGLIEIKLKGACYHYIWDTFLDNIADSNIFNRENILNWYTLNENTQLLQIFSHKNNQWLDLQTSFILNSNGYFDLKFYLTFNELNAISETAEITKFKFRLILNQTHYLQAYNSPYTSINSFLKKSIIIDGNQKLMDYILKNELSGTGTISNPYIIENLKLNPVLGDALSILNTDLYLIIGIKLSPISIPPGIYPLLITRKSTKCLLPRQENF